MAVRIDNDDGRTNNKKNLHNADYLQFMPSRCLIAQRSRISPEAVNKLFFPRMISIHDLDLKPTIHERKIKNMYLLTYFT